MTGRGDDDAADQERDERGQHGHDDRRRRAGRATASPRASAARRRRRRLGVGAAAPALRLVRRLVRLMLPPPSRRPPSISRPISCSDTSRRVLADDLALVDDEDAVGERQHLLELERDEQDRAPLVALLDEPPVQVLDRADVEAARRLRRDQHLRVARDLARDDDLLLVAAREPARARQRAAAAHVELADQRCARARRAASGRASPTSRPAARRSRGARCSRRSRTRARARAAGDPRGCGRRRRRASRGRSRGAASRPATLTVPLCDLAQAGDRVDQLGLPVAVDARDADDLAGADARTRRRAPSRCPRSSTTCRSSTVEQRLARLRRAASRRAAAPRARPSPARATPRSRPRAARVSIFLPRRRTVIRSAISSTSFSLWLMKMIDLPVAPGGS